jgi:UDP-GlcNAc:undecaprenyl-phosphate GlcNAc-1-phosphate transferase
MSNYILIIIFSSAISYFITPFVRSFSLKYGILDRPNRVKIHYVPMPKAGGLAIIFAFIVSLFIYSLFIAPIKDLGLITLCLLVIGALGFYDDVAGASPSLKLSIQVLVGIILFISGYRIGMLPYLLSLPITLLWLSGVTNAINLQDGMDGLAAGICVFQSLAFAMIGIMRHDALLLAVGICAAGSCLGFLKHNFHPAKIFMGDTGSMFLGFTQAFMGILAVRHAGTFIELLIPVIVLAVPVFDTLASIFRRIFFNKDIFGADRGHFYDILREGRGFSYIQVVLIAYLFSLLAGVGAICLI